MPPERVDLLSALRPTHLSTSFARSGNGKEPEKATPPAAPAPASAREAERPAPAPAAPAPSPALAHEEVDLADVRAELVEDEILMQRILGLLYRRKKQNPHGGYISILDMEKILKVEREGATFIMSYMKSHKTMEMDDKSRMSITVTGIDYLRRTLGVQAALQSKVLRDAAEPPADPAE